MDKDSKIVMYLAINSSLKLRPGRVAAQVGHTVQLLVENLIEKANESNFTNKEFQNYVQWKLSPVKVVLQAPEEEIHLLAKKGVSFSDDVDGQTRMTCVGFYPGQDFDSTQYKLY